MTNWQALVFFEDESAEPDPLDVTLHLKNLYDLVVGSMDWGSGFLDSEQMMQVAELGHRLGFDVPECGAVVASFNHIASVLVLPRRSDMPDHTFTVCSLPLWHPDQKHRGEIRAESGGPPPR